MFKPATPFPTDISIVANEPNATDLLSFVASENRFKRERETQSVVSHVTEDGFLPLFSTAWHGMADK